MFWLIVLLLIPLAVTGGVGLSKDIVRLLVEAAGIAHVGAFGRTT